MICIPELNSSEALTMLTKWIQDEDQLGIVSMRAKDAADADDSAALDESAAGLRCPTRCRASSIRG